MSNSLRRHRLMLGAAASIITAATTPAAVAQTRPALEGHVTSLGRRFLLADSIARAYNDSVARASTKLDNIVAGVFHIAAPPRLTTMARDAAAVADADLRRLFGGATDRLSNRRLVIRASGANGRDTNQVVIAELDSAANETYSGYAPRNVEQIARALKNRGLNVLTHDLGPAFNAWLSATIWTEPMTAADWSNARLVVVSSRAGVARGCYRGATADCVALLGLASATDTIPVPVNPIRATLVQEAARLGGAGAYERLVMTPGDVAERIAGAARVPFDSVIRSWQYNMRYTRVASDAMSPTIAVASLGWIALCVGLSLRSSRWR